MSNKPKSRGSLLTAASITSFSLTLLGGSFAVLAGIVPLQALSVAERVDVGTLLFVAPLLILVLSVVFEAARIALRSTPLPEPRPVRITRWAEIERPIR
jgi:hypothetical protein